jgi:hypothetical protein
MTRGRNRLINNLTGIRYHQEMECVTIIQKLKLSSGE